MIGRLARRPAISSRLLIPNEAVAVANDTDYGLAAYLFSSDRQHAKAIAARMLDGREYGLSGLDAFLETKAVLGAFATS